MSQPDDLGLISPGVTDVALPVCKWKEIKKIWKERSIQFKEYIAAFKPNQTGESVCPIMRDWFTVVYSDATTVTITDK